MLPSLEDGCCGGPSQGAAAAAAPLDDQHRGGEHQHDETKMQVDSVTPSCDVPTPLAASPSLFLPSSTSVSVACGVPPAVFLPAVVVPPAVAVAAAVTLPLPVAPLISESSLLLSQYQRISQLGSAPHSTPSARVGATADEEFDPLQPSRAATRGLPKNAAELWKFMDAYFSVPTGRDLDSLARLAFPSLGLDCADDGGSHRFDDDLLVPVSATRSSRRGLTRPDQSRMMHTSPHTHMMQTVEGTDRTLVHTQEEHMQLDYFLSHAQSTCGPLIAVSAPAAPAATGSVADNRMHSAEQSSTAESDRTNIPPASEIESRLPSGPIDSDHLSAAATAAATTTPDVTLATAAATDAPLTTIASLIPIAPSPILPPSDSPPASYHRYSDSRIVFSALASALPLRLHSCSESQLQMIIHAVWQWMDRHTQDKFNSLQLPSDAYACVATAAAAFYASIPPPPVRALVSVPPPLALVGSPNGLISASPTPSPVDPTAATRASDTTEMVPASTEATPSSRPADGSPPADGVEDDEEENDLDVESLSLEAAQEMVEKIASQNQLTACRLQQMACRYMIGSLHLRHPTLIDTISDPTCVSDLRDLVSYARHGVVMNPRSSRPFTFSLTGTFSRRANDKRRMDLIVSKEEKACIDQWISHVDAQQYWKVRKAEEDRKNAEQQGGGRTGAGKGKGHAERVDSTYVQAQLKSQGLSTDTSLAGPSANGAVALTDASQLASAVEEEEEPDIVCCVCGDGDCEDDNQIIFCDRCDIAVHLECYGMSDVPEGEWYCSPCSMLISLGHIRPTPSSPQYACAVCWQKGGAMKRLLIEKKHYKKTLQVLHSGDSHTHPPSQLTFAHLACALWIGELFLGDADTMSPICGLHNVNPQRFKLKCSICKVAGGACVQCSEKKCCVAYHMQCALEHGVQIDTINDSSQPSGLSYVVWCEKHRNVPRTNTVLKAAVESQVQGGSSSSTAAAAKQCQVCCYAVPPVPIKGVADEMLQCTNCDLQVHRWCYGDMRPMQSRTRAIVEEITNSPSTSLDTDTAVTEAAPLATVVAADATSESDRTVDHALLANGGANEFLCRACEWRAHDSARTSPACTLCLATQGALKPTEDGRWVCLPCAYFTPELFFGDPDALEPISGVQTAWKARSKLPCLICDRSSGCPVQCFNVRCLTSYHISCAYAQGWEFAQNPKNTNNCPFISFCGAHSRVPSGGVTAITAQPQFANATFSSFTLPDAADAMEDDAATGDAATTTTTPTKKKSKDTKGSSTSATHKRKRANDRYDDDDDDDDSVVLLDDTDDDAMDDTDTYRHRGTKSRGAPAAAAESAKWRLTSGVGQLVFESKNSKRSAAAAAAADADRTPSRVQKHRRLAFKLNRVPVHLFVDDATSGFVLDRLFPRRALDDGAMVDGAPQGKLNLHGSVSAHGRSAASRSSQSRLKARRQQKRHAVAHAHGDDATDATDATDAGTRRPAAASGALDRQPIGIDLAADAAATDDVLYCLCRQPYGSTNAMMIGCDGCNGWFHLECLNIVGDAATAAMQQEVWFCLDCQAKDRDQ